VADSKLAYAWDVYNTTASAFPTSAPDYTDIENTRLLKHNIMTMGALTAVYSTTGSASPLPVSSLPSATATSSSNPLSKSTRIGIGIGVSIGGIFLILTLIAIFTLMRRNRKRQKAFRKLHRDKSELHGTSSQLKLDPIEMDEDHQRKEIDGVEKPAEITGQPVCELPGTTPHVEIGSGEQNRDTDRDTGDGSATGVI
jgi:hypothetical protein